jgi:iron(III) transport system permease protein
MRLTAPPADHVQRRSAGAGARVVMLVCLVLLAVFMIWPIGLLCVEAFRERTAGGGVSWTLAYVADVVRDPVLRDSLLNSLLVATFVTVICLLIATPMALVSVRCSFPGRQLLSGLVLVPLILPPFVGAIGLRHLLGRYGALNAVLINLGWVDPADPVDFLGGARFWGVVVMEALHLYPIVYLNLSAALANLDPSLEQAAANLGVKPWASFRRIVWPLILPGAFAGGVLVFIWSFTELGTPLMFDYYRVAPVQVFWGVQEMASNPRPYALVVVMLVTAVLVYALGRRLVGASAYAVSTRAMTAATSRRLRGFAAMAAAGGLGAVTLLAVLPHLAVVVTSLSAPGQWYRDVLPSEWTTAHYAAALGHPLAAGSIRNSLLYSSCAMVGAVALGFAVAYLVVRLPGRATKLLDALAMLPLSVPGLVMAFGYVAMTLRWPFPQLAAFLEARGWSGLSALCAVTGQSPNPFAFLVIAYAVRRLPYVVRAVAAGLGQTGGDLEDAAANLGATRPYAIRRIVVPLVAANLLAGGLLAFSFAMLEVSDSLILAQTESHYPLTKAIYVLFQRLGDGPYIASALGAWGMVLMATTLVAVSAALGKRLGAVFRL